MPKYKPTLDDIDPDVKKCAVCGLDLLDGEEEACVGMCEMAWEMFKQDHEDWLFDRMMDIEWGE